MFFSSIPPNFRKGGGGTKDPSVSPSNDGKGLILGWYALNVCLVGPYIALASI